MAFPTKEERAKKLAEEQQKEQSGSAGSTADREKMIPVSELKETIDRMVQERLDSQPAPKKMHVEDSNKTVSNDELPDIPDFEYKDRTYISLISKSAVSQGIRNKHTKISPLQYTHPVTKNVHALRYTSNLPSFFMDKQKDQVAISSHILMKEGFLKVPKENTVLQKFLAIHPDNGATFKEYDEIEEAKKLVEKEDLLFSAQKLAREIDYERLVAVARVLIKSYSEEWSSAETKQNVYAHIAKDPEKFIRLANDQNLIIRSLAKTGVARGVLQYENRRFYVLDMNDKKEHVYSVDFGEDEFDAISKWGTNTKEGKDFFEFLQGQL